MTPTHAAAPTASPEPPAVDGPASDLRARITALRRELATTTQSYQAARRTRRGDQVVLLLRKRSAVMQQLFDAQRELILQFRSGIESAPPKGE
jgi:hypothetical protein